MIHCLTSPHTCIIFLFFSRWFKHAPPDNMKFGVGSILRPIPSNLSMLSLGDVIKRYDTSFHGYSDDTQLYIYVFPDDTGPI